MTRYLERLVARAGVAMDAPVSPAPQLPHAYPPGDPFENVEVSNTAAAEPPFSVPPALHGPKLSVEPPFSIERLESRVVPQLESRTEPPAPRTAPPVEQTIPAVVLPSPMSFDPVDAPPRQEVHEENGRPALIPTETVIERQTIQEKAKSAEPAAQSPGLSAAGIEAEVLARLMPALDAWYASDASGAPSAPAAPAVPPAIAPQRRDREPAAIVQTPQLVIGSISVEVVAAPAVAPTAAPRPRTIAGPARESHPFPSRLGFGVGQM